MPNPGALKIRTLKNRADHFHGWRNNAENQIRFVWLGVDDLLKHLREGVAITSEAHFP